MEEVDDLLQRLLGLVLTGHILERDAGGLLHIDLGVGLAHAADAAEAAAAVLGQHAEHQHEQSHHDDGGQDILHHEHQHRVHLRLIGAGIRHVVLLQQGHQRGVADIFQIGRVQRQLGVLGLGVGLGRRRAVLILLLGVGVALHRRDVDGVVLELHLRRLAAFDEGHHLAVLDLVAGGLAGGIAVVGAEVVECYRQHQCPRHQRQDAPQIIAALVVFVVFIVVGHAYPP